MKKLFLSILSLLLIASTGIAQTRIIEHPQFESTNTISFEITKLEFKNSETVLYCDVYNSPGEWILLSSSSYLKGKSGKTYKVIRSEGFELDKQIKMPASGFVSFKLHLKPIDKAEKSFDFFEGDNDRDFRIMGIKTYHVKPKVAAIHCLLKGVVIDRPQSNRLILMKQGESTRTSRICIPVRNGKFEYVLNCQNLESYSLIFSEELRDGRPATFFSEPGIVSFKLYPMNLAYQNVVIGGRLNREYSAYRALADSLFNTRAIEKEKEKLEKEDRVFTDAAKQLTRKMKSTKDELVLDSLNVLAKRLDDSGAALTPEAKSVQNQDIKIGKDWHKWQKQYIKNSNSIVSLSLLVGRMSSAMSYEKEEIPELINLFNTVFVKKYPTHPLTDKMNTLIKSYTSIQVGKSYIDFTAPDFNKNQVTLSSQIKGKIALIDFWASWCAPCRKNAKNMIPVYEAYKDKGFIIVGIAREDEFKDGVNAAKKDKYPWLNLIELKDKGKIWEKYGVGGAGATFLVDKNGVILAISPTDEEVRTILEKLLK